MSERKEPTGFEELKELFARLRAPDGCPWDRKQTHDSLKPYLVEESYEVLQTLDDGDPQKLREELGDLLLQIMLHAQIASEEGEFTIDDVIQTLRDKLIHRHPHVFGEVKVKDAAEVKQNWELLKQNERHESNGSLLSGAPQSMPALAYGQSIQRRAADIGFDWRKTEQVLDKLVEEVDEIRSVSNQEQQICEFGDILFTLVNLARRLGIDAETALRGANRRFFERFTCMEQLCRERGIKLGDLSLEEQDALWNEAKKKLAR